jgi:hypothetical protein
MLSTITLPEDLKTRLELLTRVGAALVVAFYVSGYLVIEFSNASVGIVNFGLFRAKVLAAGVLFAFFLMLPLLDWTKVIGDYGAPEWTARTISRSNLPEARAREYLSSRRVLEFFVSSLAMAWLLSISILGSDWIGRYAALSLAFVVAAVASIVVFNFQFSKHPFASAVLAWTISLLGGGLVILLQIRQTKVGLVEAWFLFVGYAAHRIRVMSEVKHWRDAEWHWIIILILSVPGFFGVYLYRKIPEKIGGGKPTRSVFQFVNQSPIDSASKDELWMLDETDMGFYVLRHPDEHKAVFLPRSSVAAIYFEAGSAGE